MSIKPARRATPLLLFLAGLVILGTGYLLGKDGLGPDRLLRRSEKTGETRGRPARKVAREEAPSEGETGEQDREAAARPNQEQGEGTHEEKGVIRFESEGLKLAHLRIEPVRTGSVSSRLVVIGTVEPNLAGVVRVTSQVAGRITNVPVNVGDGVRAGQALTTLASTELAQAQAVYRQAAARASVARLDLQRQQKLARLGAFGSPAIEAARAQATTAQAEIDTARSELDVAQAGVTEAESQLRSLQAAREQAQTEVKVTQSRFNRADLLLKAGIVSQQGWEQAQADYKHSQADVEAAEANIAQGQAKLEMARATLRAAQVKLEATRSRGRIVTKALARDEAVYRGRYMTSREIVAAEAAWRQAQLDERAAAANIRLLGGVPGGGDLLTVTAPLGGRVTERLVTQGETVTPDKTLFTIINLRTVWVQLNVYQKDLPTVRIGQAVTVTSDAAPGRTFTGAVSSISDVVEEATRTVKVRCVIQNAGSVLKPQMFVRGTIAASGRARALVVSADAVQQLGGKSVVFTAGDQQGEFQPRPVEIGAKLGDRIEIRSGLMVGERVVTHNAFLIKAQAMKGELGEGDEEKEQKR